MKNKILFILYLITFTLYCTSIYGISIKNRALFVLFSLLVFIVPLLFVGFRLSFLVALFQFFNFFWFRLLFRNANGSLLLIATISVIPLISFGYTNEVKKKFLRLIYPYILSIIILFGIELILRESFLSNFLDVEVRVRNSNIQIDSRSNYLINHDKDTVFIDSVGRKFSVSKPEGVYRIICLGSSSTQGHGAGLESYPVRIEEILSDKVEGIEVINAGRGGVRFYNLFIYFKDILPKLKPDLLVVYFGYNDDSPAVYRYYQRAREIIHKYPFINNIEDLEYALNFKFCSKTLLRVYRWLFSSRLFTALKFGLDAVVNHYTLPKPDETQKKLFKEKTIRMLVDYCILSKIPVVLIPEVIMYDNGEYAGYFQDVKDEGKKVYYYQPDRTGLVEYLTDSIHFNRQGYSNLANQIVSFILEKDFISNDE